MLTTPPASELLVDLARRGLSLRVVAGKIMVTPASRLTPKDRETIGKYRVDLLAMLSPGEPWNTTTALRLMNEADALAERLSVSGRHPEMADAAAMVTSAFATPDLETVRFAVGQFTALVRKHATKRDSDRERQHSG
jgi:hypothetical protein